MICGSILGLRTRPLWKQKKNSTAGITGTDEPFPINFFVLYSQEVGLLESPTKPAKCVMVR